MLDDVELVGEYQGSGLIDAPFLVRRGDGAMIQVSRLMFEVASHLNSKRSLERVAEAVSDSIGRRVTGDNVHFLLVNKLCPLGLIGEVNRSPGFQPARLATTAHRGHVLSKSTVDRVARALQFLFRWPAMAVVLTSFVVLDVHLVQNGGFQTGILEVAQRPVLLIALTGLIIVSMAAHEFGHAAACRYGGARPGPVGVTLYLVWPAFFADVTDAYRLDRRGRLRTDLGGLYFSAIFILVTALLYMVTGASWLLFAIAAQHLQGVAQLLPFPRLDGYHVVCDLAGVPNMVGRIKPVLAGLVRPGRIDPRAAALKPWVRLVVAAWMVIAFLGFGSVMVFLARLGPDYIAGAWAATESAARDLVARIDTNDFPVALARLVQLMFLLMLPLGIIAMLARVVHALLLRARRSAPESALATKLASGATLSPGAGQADWEPRPRARASWSTAVALVAIVVGFALFERLSPTVRAATRRRETFLSPVKGKRMLHRLLARSRGTVH